MSTGVKFPPYNTSWHAVELNYTKGELSVLVDYRNKQSKLFSMTFELGDKVTIGSGRGNAGIFLSLSLSLSLFSFFWKTKPYITRIPDDSVLHFASGLVGCMREIRVNDERLEPRYVINTERVIGEVALDNCQFVDPCTRPNTCEHGGKCSVKEDRITCDCAGTGYIGKNCHFGECEALA